MNPVMTQDIPTYLVFQGIHTREGEVVGYEALLRHPHIKSPLDVVQYLCGNTAVQHIEKTLQTAAPLEDGKGSLHINVTPEILVVAGEILKRTPLNITLELAEEFDFTPYLKYLHYINRPVYLDDIDKSPYWLSLVSHPFVKGIKTSVEYYRSTLSSHPNIIHSLAGFARSHELRYVLEGLENPGDLVNVPDDVMIQGYVYSKPQELSHLRLIQ